MALDVSNIIPLTHFVKASDILQFYSLLTGSMTDQPVTLANTLTLNKFGTALVVVNNASIGGTLTVAGQAGLGSVSTGVILATSITGTGPIWSNVNGSGAGGLFAGASFDVQWYRSAADTWRTPDAVVIDTALNVGGAIWSTVNGSAAAGFFAGAAADVQWYRSAADTWRTPDAVVIDTSLTVTGPSTLASAAVTAALTAGSIAARKATTTYAANGALTISDGLVQLTKAGVNDMTLADPVAGDDGTVMIISAATANAHKVTNAGSGFNNGGGASDVATFGGAVGDYLAVFASGSRWWVLANRNVTLA